MMKETNGKKILIVDDQKEIAEIIKYNLIAQGYQVFTAGNGKEGLEKAIFCLPHVILFDIMMPEISGLEMLQKLKLNPLTENIKTVALSAKNNLKDIVGEDELCADKYLAKPFKFKELFDYISELI